jgi:hypothetical protein
MIANEVSRRSPNDHQARLSGERFCTKLLCAPRLNTLTSSATTPSAVTHRRIRRRRAHQLNRIDSAET